MNRAQQHIISNRVRNYMFFGLFLIAFLLPIASWAQVQFEAKVSKNKLAMNERLRIDFVMNVDGDNFIPPTFEGFRIVGGPSQQVSQTWVNGKGTISKTYSYILLPIQKGNLTIKQASIDINGQTYKTSAITLEVTAAVEQPRDPDDNSISTADAVHLVAEVSKTNPYINEPITVVYKLYFSHNIGINNWNELDKPKYNNFWSQNIDIKKLVAEEGKYNGQPFRYVVLRKTVLYPQIEGKLEIEPLTLDVDLEIPTNRRTIFGTPFTRRDNKRVSAGSNTITVKPLPIAGKPSDFSGAVGKFDFNVVPSRTSVKHGESITLDISVTGNGNLKLLSLPKPILPAALEMYDPVSQENVNTSLSGMSGKVSDSYTIIPQYKGEFVLKPMAFSYFDLSTATYKTLYSQEITITVLDGPTATGNNVTAVTDQTNKKSLSAGDQFRFIHLHTKLKPKYNKNFFGSVPFYVSLILPFLLIPFVVIFRKKKQAFDNDFEGNKTRMSNRLAKKYLSEAKKQLDHSPLFYVALEKAMHNFLKAKLKIETSEMSKETIQSLLLEKEAKVFTVEEFMMLMENCEFARYAPTTSHAVQGDYQKAVQIISDLEKQIQK